MYDFDLKIQKHSSFGIADAIMSLLERGCWRLESEHGDEVLEEFGLTLVADAWNNCREQGYVIRGGVGRHYFAICFAECRNSDTPVIFHWEGHGPPPGHGPEDSSWKRLFAKNVDEAVATILELIEGYTREFLERRTVEKIEKGKKLREQGGIE